MKIIDRADTTDAASLTLSKQGTQQLDRSLVSLAFAALLLIEFVLFFYHFEKYVKPYHLVNFDQLSTYLSAYNNYFSLVQDHKFADDYWLWTGANKGLLLPNLALLSTLILGPSRFAVNLVNFLFLLLAQVAVVGVVWKSQGKAAAGLALGFFLLSGTHFYQVGGLDDLRRDYCGMALFGVAFLFGWRWLCLGDRTSFASSVAAFALLTLSRFVLMIFWTVGLAMLALTVWFTKIGGTQSDPRRLFRRLSSLLVGPVLGCALQLSINWDGVNGHYTQLKFTSEDALRWKEFGVHTLAERLLYFPNSFWEHFQVMFLAAAVIVAVSCFLLLIRKLTQRNQFSLPSCANDIQSLGDLKVACLLLIGTMTAFYVVLTNYSPHPSMVGIFSIPLATCLAIFCDRILRKSVSLKWRTAIVCGAVSLCVATLCYEFKRPPSPPHPNLSSARSVSKIMHTVVSSSKSHEGAPCTIYWSIVHDGLNGMAFDVAWYEQQHKMLPGFRHKHVPAFPPLPVQEYLADLRAADLAVVPLVMPAPPPGWFEYPGIDSLRKQLPAIQTALSADFQLIEKCGDISFGQPNAWTIGVYKRVNGSGESYLFKPGDDIQGMSHLDPRWAKYLKK